MVLKEEIKENMDLFLAEAGDCLELVASELGESSESADRRRLLSCAFSMFRSVHAVRGMAGMMEFAKIDRMARKMETILDDIVKEKREFNDKTREALYECFDFLASFIGAAFLDEPEDESGGIEEAVSRIDDILSGKSSAAQGGVAPDEKGPPVSGTTRKMLGELDDLRLLVAWKSPGNLFEIRIDVERECYQKYLSPLTFFEALKELGEIVLYVADAGGIPDIGSLDLAAADISLNIVLRTNESAEGLRKKLQNGRLRVRDLRAPSAAEDAGEFADVPEAEISPYHNIFLAEAAEMTDAMSDAILALEKDPGDAATLYEATRLMHSLKSSAAAVGYPNISGLSHSMESLFDALKENKSLLSSDLVSAMLGAVDEIRRIVALAADGSGRDIDLSDFTVTFGKIAEAGGSGSGRPASEERPASPGETRPPEDESEKVPDGGPLHAAASADDAAAGMPQAIQTLRVDLAKLDALINMVGELGTARTNLFQISGRLGGTFRNKKILYEMEDSISALERKTGELAGRLEELSGRSSPSGSGEAFRELVRVASSFSDVAGSLKSVQSELKALFRHESDVRELGVSAGKFGKVINNLQAAIMDVRTVPLSILFRRFRRVVRDLARSGGKAVELEIRGEDTAVDKKVIDELGNPLTHIIRNAVDHAIESPAERAAKGKNETGRIIISAYREGPNICIDVADDGRGISSGKIIGKAVEKGIIDRSEASAMTRQQVLALIMAPGFSTAETVTDISGRGVGMDVVNKSVESLKGSLDIRSRENEGTTFTIRLPLNLALIPALLVRIGRCSFSIPLESVIEIVKVPAGEMSVFEGVPTLSFRGGVTAVVDLSAIGIRDRAAQSEVPTVVVMGAGGQFIGVCVDELIGREELVIKPLSEDFKKVEGISGASILGDGSISLIIDVPALVRRTTAGRAE